jgi:ParB family chromosome partitioning protein
MSERPAQRPRLGRGLSSLIGSTAAASTTETGRYQSVSTDGKPDSPRMAETPVREAGPSEVSAGPTEVPVEQISANPYQPRREFAPEALNELAESIRRQGVLQPLLIARCPDPNADTPFVLIAGERRLRASRQAGLSTVPCVVREATAEQMMEWALVENIHRQDLNPIERAQAYQEYIERFELSQADAAERLGQARTTVANHLRILNLTQDVQSLIVDGRLSFGHAKVLAALIGQPDRQLRLARRCIEQGLSVRRLEALVESPEADEKPRSQRRPLPAYLQDFEQQLTQAVGTRVAIRPGRAKHTGRIVIDYYNLEDFDRIVAGLGADLDS